MIRYGPLDVTESGLNLPTYDYVANTSTSTSDSFAFYSGGSGGTKLATVTIEYTDSSKTTIQTVTKTVP